MIQSPSGISAISAIATGEIMLTKKWALKFKICAIYLNTLGFGCLWKGRINKYQVMSI